MCDDADLGSIYFRTVSKPLVLALEAWLREQRDRVSAKSEIAKAINYSLNRWTSFTRFLDDGRICISNNAAERAVRGVALGRAIGHSPVRMQAVIAQPPSTH
jgi:transposase